MTVEIIGYKFVQDELHLYAVDVDNRNLQFLERNRFDESSERELEFVFTKESFGYLNNWLKRQKAVQDRHPETLGEAVRATLGSITTLSGKYLEFA